MENNSIKVGIVQENPIVGDISGNTELAISAINALLKEKPDVVLFTEMFLTGYPPEDLLFREDLLESVDRAIALLSDKFPEIYLVLGYPRKKGKNLYNAAGVIHNGSLQSEYFKQELPNYRVFDEKRYFTPGKGPLLFEVKEKKIAVTICEDIWHTKAIRQASKKGADLVLNLNASPFHRNKSSERQRLLVKHANNFSLPIVYANQVGGQDELVFDGSSFVVCPHMGACVRLKSFDTETRVVDFFESKEGNLLIDSETLPETSDLKDVYDALVLGARDYLQKNRFPGAIIGSSGGIDSALTAAIAADAIGGNAGAETTGIGTSNLPEHEHDFEGASGTQFYGVRVGAGEPVDANAISLPIESGLGGTQGIASSGGIKTDATLGTPLNVMNPFLAVNYIIYTGV